MPSIGTQRREVSQLPIPERKPDYYIGATGRPILTAHHTTMHRTERSPPKTSDSENGTRNSKLNKCLYNLTIRNGGYPTTSNSDRHGNSRRVSNKTEHDITSAPAPPTRGRCSKSPPQISGSSRSGAPDTGGRYAVGTAGGWSSTAAYHKTAGGGICGPQTDRSRSVTSLPAATRLLAARAGGTRPSPEDARPGSLVLQQQCRYSSHHKQLDNRLSYQRSYDRNIFGYNQRMDQFVLPPLQI